MFAERRTKDDLNCIFFWIPASIAGAAAVVPNGTKIFFAKETATFNNEPVNLLNNDPTSPPDWIILEIWGLESFKLVDINYLVIKCIS